MKSIIFYIVLIIMMLVGFWPVLLVFLVTVPFDRQRHVVHSISGFFSRLIFKLNPTWSVEVNGLENINKDQNYLVVVNHNSMFDIPIMYYLPMEYKWVSKKEVTRWPILGWVLLMHDDITIDRGSKNSIKVLLKRGMEKLSSGLSVIIFPEGTRSKTGEIGRFHEGAFLLAKKSGKAVLPCRIEGTGTMFKGWKFTMPHKFVITVMPEITEDQVNNSSVKELRDITRALYN